MSTLIPTAETPAALAQHGSLRLRVERDGERSVVTHSAGAVPLAPRIVPGRPGWASVVLLQTAAGPLAGDELAIDVEVAAGARLDLRTLAATIAYPADAPARQRARCRVAAGGRLAWLPQPLVLGEGCLFESSLDVSLDDGAACVLRETVVCGRHREPAGSYRGSLRADLGGAPLLRDAVVLPAGDRAPAGSLAVLGDARAYVSLALLGVRPDQSAAGQLDLAGPGAVVRLLGGGTADLERLLAPVEADYLLVLDGLR